MMGILKIPSYSEIVHVVLLFDLDDLNQVLRIVDKPQQTNLESMWGCIVWRPRFTEHLHSCVREYGLADFARIMNMAIELGMSFRGVHVEGTYADLGTYEEIMELEQQYRAP